MSALAAVLAPALVACTPLDTAPPAAASVDAVGQEVPEPAVAPIEPASPAPLPDPVPVADPPAPEAAPAAVPAPVESPEPMALAGTVTAGDGAGPLAGDTLYGPNSSAAEAAERLRTGRPDDAALLARMASVPTATWLGSWHGDIQTAVRNRVAEAEAAGGVPVFVAYNVPDLDCGGHSASSGGAASVAGYDSWIRDVAAGIGTAEAVVIVEPDTLALLCGNADERTRMLRSAVGVLEANPGTHTYLDAGHSAWIDAPAMAQRLQAAGIAEADGFALNVSNFETTANNVAYGSELSGLLGGARFVVDTSRNGNGPGNDWCNPSGRALGQPTTTETGHALVDAFIWIKAPGESDGTCNGGPAAGQFWTDYALGLARP